MVTYDDHRPPEDYYPPGDGTGPWGEAARDVSRQVHPGAFKSIPEDAYTKPGVIWGIPLLPRWRRPAALGLDVATVVGVNAVAHAIFGEGLALVLTIAFAIASAGGYLTKPGESIGKTVLGLRTVCPARYPGGWGFVRPSRKAALARCALHWLDVMVFGLGLLWPFVGRWHQTWADILTGSYTIFGPDLGKIQRAPRMCQRFRL